MTTYFCSFCFEKIDRAQTICPHCGTNIADLEANTSYEARLTHALGHPVSEVRMGAIISLGNLNYQEAALPLANCALEYPNDNVQNLEILSSLEKLTYSPERESAISLLKTHPSQIIRKWVRQIK